MLLLSMLPVMLVLFFIYRRDVIRHKMKEELEKKILHTIAVKSDEIVWMKPGKEIFVNGKMFDIKTEKEENGYTTFSGLYDYEETALNKTLNSGWNKKNTEENSPVMQFFQFLKSLYTYQYESENDILLTAYEFEESSPPNLASSFLTILTPPPKVLL
ncbi:MAG: hypothetical protein IPH18_06425 [Chitinophagaceae bacterium]|nr:hypothetical protein [Chitinophagaceae bacterium]